MGVDEYGVDENGKKKKCDDTPLNTDSILSIHVIDCRKKALSVSSSTAVINLPKLTLR